MPVDVLIVGGRCAGATLANFLARRGKRVVIVERDDMPSDQPMSTHFISSHGMSIMDELGIGEKLRKIAPPVPWFMNGIESDVARIAFPKGREGSCPRRTELDALLVEEARSAGAEVRLRTKLVDVLRDGERIVGGVVEHAGKREEIHARIVVGADGPSSKVAELVGAEEYKGYDAPRGAFWAYWPRPRWYSEDEQYLGGASIIHYGEDCRMIFPTNTDQLLIGIAFPMTSFARSWKGRHRAVYLERVRSHPLTRRLTSGEPLGKIVGMVDARFFFRQAAGPGWALVGDAGLFKDPSPGLGITDAFRDAKALAAAIDVGTDAALERYWRERDVHSLELFEFAKDLGAVDYNNVFNRALFRRIAAKKELGQRLLAVQDRRLSPFAAFTTAEIVRWTLAEVVRGRLSILKPFLAAGKRGAETAKELAAWKARVAG